MGVKITERKTKRFGVGVHSSCSFDLKVKHLTKSLYSVREANCWNFFTRKILNALMCNKYHSFFML